MYKPNKIEMRATRRKSIFRSRRRTMHKMHKMHKRGGVLGGIELWNFSVSCNNGDQYTSPHEHTLIGARNAAREYCQTRGGMNGRARYTNITIMLPATAPRHVTKCSSRSRFTPSRAGP